MKIQILTSELSIFFVHLLSMKGIAVNKTNTVLSPWCLTSDRGVKATAGAPQSKEKNTGPNCILTEFSIYKIRTSVLPTTQNCH